jgi:hypothetical protein
MRHCYECEKDMCTQCIDGHECKPIHKFIERLNEPLAICLANFGYYFASESEKDGQMIFEFLSEEAPRMEVRIDKENQ